MNFGISGWDPKQFRYYVSAGASLLLPSPCIKHSTTKSKFYKSKKKKVCKGWSTFNTSSAQNLAQRPIFDGLRHNRCFGQIAHQSSNQQKNELLALRLSYKESIFSNEPYDLGKKDFNINLNDVLKGSDFSYNPKIVLKEAEKKVWIKDIDKIDFSSALDILKWDNNRKDLPLFDNLTAFFMTALRGIATLGVKDPKITFLRGIQIGTREVDAGIKIGATLTVLGTVGVTTDGTIFIEPSSIFKERLTFIKEINDKWEYLFSKRNFWLGAFAIGAIYIGRRTYHYVKNNENFIPKKRQQRLVLD